jgi:hypothetical protein
VKGYIITVKKARLAVNSVAKHSPLLLAMIYMITMASGYNSGTYFSYIVGTALWGS